MIAIALAIGVGLPLLFLRGRTLARCLAGEIGATIVLIVAGRIAPRLEPFFAATIVAAAVVVVLSLSIATGRDVRWNANLAALGALVVYLCLIPSMTRAPIDGDEPYYLLVTDSLLHDHDLDLRNQYPNTARITGRVALEPQPNDPVGEHGERYSRHEPFFPLLLVPGYAIAGLPGALTIVALFGALTVRSTVRLLEEEAIDDATIRAVFPFIAFGPPLIFYAARVWPEAPAAFAFAELLRGVRQRRGRRWIVALFALVMLKLRFVLVAVMAGVQAGWKRRRGAGAPLALALLLVVPLAIVFTISGSVLNVHSWRELLQFDPRDYLRGAFGLLLDGAAGLLFQAPFYLLGILALARWRSAPEGYRTGWFLALLYLAVLVPRSEWHGGWSPPLRYVTFFMPVLALGAASIWNRVSAPVVALIATGTIAVTIHGVAFPWRLFHIANGENRAGEWLSVAMHADFSRLFPSFIRLNAAAIIASVLLFIAMVLVARDGPRIPSATILPLAAAVLFLAFRAGNQAGRRIEFEDAHVTHRGGLLYPDMYAVARFHYRGGWILRAGQSVSFLARRGRSMLHYAAPAPVTVEIGGFSYQLEPTGSGYGTAIITLPGDGRAELKVLSGAINLDRMEGL